MLCYLVFCRKDSALMRRSLEWMKKLGGCKGHDAVLTYEAGLNADEHLKLAKEVFDRVDINPVPNTINDWVEASNRMFRMTAWNAYSLKKAPFLFLEADCIPLKPRWLDSIEKEYKEKGRPFMLTSMGTPPHRSLCGNAVYPGDIPEKPEYIKLIKEYKPSPIGKYQAWDGIFQLMDPSLFSYTDLIWHDFGNSPGNYDDGKPISFRNVEEIRHIMNSSAVVFHRCKDGSVIDVLSGTDKRPRTALHGGDLGDAIYGLKVMLEMKIDTLYFSEHYPGREKMTQERVDLLKPLFLHAGLKQVEMHKDQWIDHDFTDFRSLYKYRNGDHSLLGTQAKYMGQKIDIMQPWLQLNEPKTDKIVVARSPRYHNQNFPWNDIVNQFRDRIVFLGLHSEHRAFCDKYGEVKYQQVQDFLEAAKIISGSSLLIANQSSIFSIGEALKCPRILECSPSESNRDCCLGGGEVQYCIDGNVDLSRYVSKPKPSEVPKPVKKTKSKLTKVEVKEVPVDEQITKDYQSGLTWKQLVSKHRSVGLKKLSSIVKSAKEVASA